MYDSRMDRTNPDRNFLDPELKNVVASSLIEARHPRQYALAIFEVGTASVVAGVLLLLLSVFGSTTWTPNLSAETMRHLLTLGVLGAVWSLVGAVTALVSGLLIRFWPKR
jgi:hypothetical protein